MRISSSSTAGTRPGRCTGNSSTAGVPFTSSTHAVSPAWTGGSRATAFCTGPDGPGVDAPPTYVAASRFAYFIPYEDGMMAGEDIYRPRSNIAYLTVEP